MARTKEFDVDEALTKAMEIFWAKGFEATSIQDLVDHTGVNRCSLYSTFGDKHALYVRAFNHYGTTIVANFEAMLHAADSPLEAIHAMFNALVDHVDGECKGCLITNAAVELAPHDPVVADSVRGLMQKVEDAIEGTLQRAVNAGQLEEATNTRALARQLACVAQGMIVMSKASLPKSTLKDIAVTTLASFTPAS